MKNVMTKNRILSLLKIAPSPRSLDYVQNKSQFQLHKLLTEQRHPKTWDMSFAIKKDIDTGLRQIFSVDEDISLKFYEMVEDISLLDQAAQAVSRAITEGKKIFVYGCGSTGRLAKQLESAIWRPFWRKLKKSSLWETVKASIPVDIEARFIGEMTGGDRALISALEGFEDLELVGKLQLEDRSVERRDVVFCITEGGETSSVIGAILAALEQYGVLTEDAIRDAKNHLYFIYNNPDDVLSPFDRSRSVLENEAITKINLTTGPQAITGSTRMQATTAETYVVGIILEIGIFTVLKTLLSEEELADVGFYQNTEWQERLRVFDDLRNLLANAQQDISKWTALESETYQKGNFVTYFAKEALITVFIDCAERSPTFHLFPLDTVLEAHRKCWLQVWTEGEDLNQAWTNILKRDFQGLKEKYYRPQFLARIEDTYLKDSALKSLQQAGYDQKYLYDFSFGSKNIMKRGPKEGDLGVLVCLNEETDDLSMFDSPLRRFIRLFKESNASVILVLIDDREPEEVRDIISPLKLDPDNDGIIHLGLHQGGDPLNVNKHTLLKMLLNGHSTAVMAMLGRVVGNTMTHVNPSNLKLIGRATFLIMSHVNDTITNKEWTQKCGKLQPISYAEANAILFDAMEFVAEHGGQISEVELSIIRVLEALRKKHSLSWEEALFVKKEIGLEHYLEKHNPRLRLRGERAQTKKSKHDQNQV
jgi:N-acetylmuramic acid 6-phosphate etherase